MTTLQLDMAKVTKVLNQTQERLNNWYENVKNEYGVNGIATVHYDREDARICIEYKEDGVQKTWSMAFYPEYIENGINWVFDCWAEIR